MRSCAAGIFLLASTSPAAIVADLKCARTYRGGRARCSEALQCRYGHGPANYTKEMDLHKDNTGDVSWAWRGQMCVAACDQSDTIVYECACLSNTQIKEANSIGLGSILFCIVFITLGSCMLYYNVVAAIFDSGEDDSSSCFPCGHTLRWYAGLVLFSVGTGFLASGLSIPSERYIDSGCENRSGGTRPTGDEGVNVNGILLGVGAPVGGLALAIGSTYAYERYTRNWGQSRSSSPSRRGGRAPDQGNTADLAWNVELEDGSRG